MDENIVEQNVVATRAAAECVHRCLERAMKIKDKSMYLDEDPDEWQRCEKAKVLLKEIEEVVQDVRSAGIKANVHRRAVIEAIGVRSDRDAEAAKKAAEKAYMQSDHEERIVDQLACETRQNCESVLLHS